MTAQGTGSSSSEQGRQVSPRPAKLQQALERVEANIRDYGALESEPPVDREAQRARELDDALRRAGVPKRYRSVAAEHRFDDQVAEGVGLFIGGAVGTGKTEVSCAVLKAFVENSEWSLGDESRFRAKAKFITFVDFLGAIRGSYNSTTSESEAAIMDKASSCELLVLDDVGGKGASSVWAISRLYQLVNTRYNEMLPTIVTTQYVGGAFAKSLTVGGNQAEVDAIVSRLRQMCVPMMVKGDDHRKAAATGYPRLVYAREEAE